jgi:MFS family permease
MQVVGGRFSDRRGRRRLILVGSGFLIACWLTSAGAFFFGSQALVYLAYLLWGLEAKLVAHLVRYGLLYLLSRGDPTLFGLFS